MAKIIGRAQLGERGSLSFFQEDGGKWNYAQIDLEGHEGESATIHLQHMSTKLIHELADEIKRVAFFLERAAEKKKIQST